MDWGKSGILVLLFGKKHIGERSATHWASVELEIHNFGDQILLPVLYNQIVGIKIGFTGS
jgi:hypothetical protein